MQQVDLPRIRPNHFLCAAVFGALLFAGLGSARADQYDDVTALLRQGQADQALMKAEANLASNPRDPQMRFLRGVILTDQGRKQEAIDAFTELTREYPELPEPYNNLAALYASQSQFDKAREALEAALKANPNYATARENLGDIYVRLAAESYTRAQQLDKANATVAPKLALLRQVFLPAGAAAPSTAEDKTSATVNPKKSGAKAPKR
ncbi:tetratricopeptide repeat protein [Variovorax dokdonensis]|uniref:Tetratricopeptide repeat protein n=1 Tax=Variovorax dokdonensis TaxID=344883 RepID=A0ABT7NCX4_9BURK|nr:tetratricopeptide repeat protein [Variovorax dokdonensis]MDM0045811.1 tetratricopeptide repeat protein [Variovorax dokdonensis]